MGETQVTSGRVYDSYTFLFIIYKIIMVSGGRMALYKYHYIELDTKRSPRISLQNIVAGETGNRLWITVTNNGETVDMSEKENDAWKYRVCLRIDSDLGTRRQDSAEANSGITFIDANTGDHGKINILLSKDSFTSGMNRAVLEIYSKRVNDNDTLICSAEWTFRAAKNPTGENAGTVYPSLIKYENDLRQLVSDTEDAIDACEDATEAANEAASSANTAASAANEAAAAANEAERDAGHAAQEAAIAANFANTAATAANSAAQDANAAADAANNAESTATSAALVADGAAQNADAKAEEAETAAAAANTAANAAQDAAYAANQAATAATAAMPVVINVRDITWNDAYTAGNGYADVDIDAIMTAVGNGAIVMMDVPHENIRMYYSLKDGGDIGFSSARLVPLSTIQFWFASLYKVPNETACRVSIRMRTVSST
jgi:hypothetical protein